VFGVTINELLSGQRLTPDAYQAAAKKTDTSRQSQLFFPEGTDGFLSC